MDYFKPQLKIKILYFSFNRGEIKNVFKNIRSNSFQEQDPPKYAHERKWNP